MPFLRRLLVVISLFLFLPLHSQTNLQFTNIGIGGGGALFSPAINPDNPQEIYMSCDMTELFYTTDGATSWQFINSFDITAFPNSRMQFTADSDLRYVLAMDFRSGDTYPVRTTNGGNSWLPITDPTGGAALYLFADPTATDRLYVSTWDKLYFSENGGQSWSLAFSDSDGNLHLAGVFWDGNTVYVGTNYGLLISDNGGETLSLDANPGLPADTGFSTFCGARNGDVLTLYGIGLHQADLYPTVQAWEYNGYQGIFRRQMDAGAGDWQQVDSGIPASVGLYQVATAGHTPDIAYVAGTDNASNYPVIYKTTDSGATWTSVFQTVNNQNIVTGWSGYQGDEDWYYGEYALGLAVSYDNPEVVVLTDLGFVHRSINGGAIWNQGYVDPTYSNPPGQPTPKDQTYRSNGLENTSAWWLHFRESGEVFAAFTDIGGMYSPDGGQTWTFDRVDRSLNSTYHFTEGTDETLYAATSSVHDLYQSTYLTDAAIDGGTGRILYSTDVGESWQVLHDFGVPVFFMAIDPTDPNVMYASVVNSEQGGIYKTTNLLAGADSDWVKLPDPPRTEGHPHSLWVLDDGSVACSFSGRRAPNFTASSGVFYSEDGGQTWQDRSHPDMFYWTKDLVIDPNFPDQNTWYACVFSGWGGDANDKGGLFLSTDRGQNWSRVNNTYRAESITLVPGDLFAGYLTTEDEGIIYIDDIYLNPSNYVLLSEEYPFLHPLRIFINGPEASDIYLTSFGNGMSRGTEVSAVSDINTAGELDIYPNPGSGIFHLELPCAAGADLDLQVFDLQGRLLVSRPERLSGEFVSLDLSGLPAGVYTVQIRADECVALGKVVIGRR